jgi:hypothetical protein
MFSIWVQEARRSCLGARPTSDNMPRRAMVPRHEVVHIGGKIVFSPARMAQTGEVKPQHVMPRFTRRGTRRAVMSWR